MPTDNTFQQPVQAIMPNQVAMPAGNTDEKVKAKDLTPGDTFIIHGKVGYNRISKVIDDNPATGEMELTKTRQEAAKRNRPIPDKPFVTLTLEDVSVVYKDPANPTLAEKYALGRFYKKADGKLCYTAIRKYNPDPTKQRQLPRVGELSPDGKTVQGRILDPGRTLASGLDATIYMSVYKTNQNPGISFDMIVLNEPLRYYVAPASAEGILASQGLLWQEPTAAPNTPAVNQGPAYNQNTNAFSAPSYSAPQTPAQSPVTPATPNVAPQVAYAPESTTPAPAAYGQPQQQTPVAPAPTGAPMPSAVATPPIQQAAPTVAPAPAPVTAPNLPTYEQPVMNAPVEPAAPAPAQAPVDPATQVPPANPTQQGSAFDVKAAFPSMPV